MTELVEKPFFFMRHAQSLDNAEKRIGGRTNVLLTPQGRAQAKAAGKHLARYRTQTLICSPLARARTTAALALPGQLPLIEEDLRERDWGILEGKPVTAMTDRFATPEKGEAWEAFRIRSQACVNRVLRLYPTPLSVAHSGIFRSLCPALGLGPDGQQIPNASVWSIAPPSKIENAWKIAKIIDPGSAMLPKP